MVNGTIKANTSKQLIDNKMTRKYFLTVFFSKPNLLGTLKLLRASTMASQVSSSDCLSTRAIARFHTESSTPGGFSHTMVVIELRLLLPWLLWLRCPLGDLKNCRLCFLLGLLLLPSPDLLLEDGETAGPNVKLDRRANCVPNTLSA